MRRPAAPPAALARRRLKQHTLESAQAVLDGAQHLVGDNEGDIQQIVRSLRTASENARLLTETLKERPWNLIRTSQPGDRKVPR